ncbi:hypothetical protein ARMGADRAFT_1090885 [Armillaria gallica]|uniref:Uncharacterized protein n=1 Tax=Armillaria gallica TaxID=47427 RepID=A0A2H3D2S9_ARMGA|nr:hypothetical protein ARMGADRAFT_1090885 [Armillaria gallica]
MSGKCKWVETEWSKVGKPQSTLSKNSIASTVSKATKKLKSVATKVKQVTSGAIKGKKTVQSPAPSTILSDNSSQSKSLGPSIAPSGTSAMNVDLPPVDNPTDSLSNSDYSLEHNCVNNLDEQTNEAELEHMMKKWSASAYAFFHPISTIEY